MSPVTLGAFRAPIGFTWSAVHDVVTIGIAAESSDGYCPSYVDFVTPAIGRFGLSESDGWELPPAVYGEPFIPENHYGVNVISGNAPGGPFTSLIWINISKVLADYPPAAGQTHVEVAVSYQGPWSLTVDGIIRSEVYRAQPVRDMHAHFAELNDLYYELWTTMDSTLRSLVYRRELVTGRAGEYQAPATFPRGDSGAWNRLRIRFPIEPDEQSGDTPLFAFL